MHKTSVGGTTDVGGARLGKSAGGTIGLRGRIILLVVFLVTTIPVFPLLAANVPFFRLFIPLHMVVHAVPLCITAVIDAWFLDGGEVTPKLIPLWSALTGVMLWPLLALGLWPALWNSSGWRKAIVIYGAAAVLATIGAAYWVFTHSGIFW